VIELMDSLKIDVEHQPLLYFGNGDKGNLIVEGPIDLQQGCYRNITVKNGGILSIQPQQTILLVSGVFEVELGGLVNFPGTSNYSNTLYIAASEIKLFGRITADGQATNNPNAGIFGGNAFFGANNPNFGVNNLNAGNSGGNVILATKRAHITGKISATPTYHQNHQNYPNQIWGNNPHYNSQCGNQGTVSLQYEEGNVTGEFSLVTLRLDRNTNQLVPI